MADYHPLIARAVAGLEKNTGDARRALYERARTALVAQLRGVSPSLSESDVTRERLALEEAIRKVEGETVRAARGEKMQAPSMPAARFRPPEMPNWDKAAASAGPSASASASAPLGRKPLPLGGRSDPMSRRAFPLPLLARQANGAAAPMLGEERYLDPIFDQPLPGDLALQDRLLAPSAPNAVPAPPMPNPPFVVPPEPQPAPPAGSPATARALLPGRARPMGERRSLLDSGLLDFRNVVAETDDLGEASTWAAKVARDHYGREVELEATEPEMLEPQQSHPSLQDLSPGQVLDGPFADEEARPMPARETAAEPADRQRKSRRMWSAGATRTLIRIASVLVLFVAVGGLLVWLWPSMQELYRLARAPEPENHETLPTARPKISDRIEPGGQQPTQPTPPNPTPGSGPTPQGAAVAQRVVLYEEDPNDANGKRYVGSAIWRTETITPGPGQTPDLAIRADVEIPDRKLSMTWSLRRNTDPSLPASHTVEIMFKLPPDFPSGGISNVPGILMKQAEQARGVPLAGLAVKVTNGFFLIGLSSTEGDRERNLQLLKERSWFDIPLVYNNNRRAILALEKGTPGERAFAEAFAAWRQ